MQQLSWIGDISFIDKYCIITCIVGVKSYFLNGHSCIITQCRYGIAMSPIGSLIIAKTVYRTSSTILQYHIFRGWGLPRQVDVVPTCSGLKIDGYWTWEMYISNRSVGFQRHGAVGFHAFHIIGMGPVSDVTVNEASGLNVVDNQGAISVDSIMGGVTDVAPGDGDISVVYGSIDIGRRSDTGSFRVAVENSSITCIISPVTLAFRIVSLRI